jgi:hypothetical protein
MSFSLSPSYSTVLINMWVVLFGFMKYGLIGWSAFVSIRIADFVMFNFLISSNFARPAMHRFFVHRLRRYLVEVFHQDSFPYLRLDKTIIWWIRKIVFWSEPHDMWDKLFSKLSFLVALTFTSFMCSFQFSLSSNVSPSIRCFLTISIFSVPMSTLSLNLVFPSTRGLLLWINMVHSNTV